MNDGFDEKGRPLNMQSIVRCNIGTMRDLQPVVVGGQESHRDKKDKDLWYDGVLEVIGYVDTTIEKIEEDRLQKIRARQLKQQEKDGIRDADSS